MSASPPIANWPPKSDESHPETPATLRDPGPPSSITQML